MNAGIPLAGGVFGVGPSGGGGGGGIPHELALELGTFSARDADLGSYRNRAAAAFPDHADSIRHAPSVADVTAIVASALEARPGWLPRALDRVRAHKRFQANAALPETRVADLNPTVARAMGLVVVGDKPHSVGATHYTSGALETVAGSPLPQGI